MALLESNNHLSIIVIIKVFTWRAPGIIIISWFAKIHFNELFLKQCNDAVKYILSFEVYTHHMNIGRIVSQRHLIIISLPLKLE